MPVVANGSTAISGTNGLVKVDSLHDNREDGTTGLVYRVTQWTLNPTSGETAWGDSDSNGFTNRKKARLDATGSVTGKMNTDRPIWENFLEGDTVELTLWLDNTLYYNLPRVLVQNLEFTIDQDSKEVIEFSFDFGADGVYYEPGNSSATGKTRTDA